MSLEKKPRRNCVVAIKASLHEELKAKADREGRILQRMVEEKLAELVEPHGLRVVEAAHE